MGLGPTASRAESQARWCVELCQAVLAPVLKLATHYSLRNVAAVRYLGNHVTLRLVECPWEGNDGRRCAMEGRGAVGSCVNLLWGQLRGWWVFASASFSAYLEARRADTLTCTALPLTRCSSWWLMKLITYLSVLPYTGGLVWECWVVRGCDSIGVHHSRTAFGLVLSLASADSPVWDRLQLTSENTGSFSPPCPHFLLILISSLHGLYQAKNTWAILETLASGNGEGKQWYNTISPLWWFSWS